MNRITFPLKPGMQGPAVTDLRDVLRICLERGALLANDEAAHRELSAKHWPAATVLDWQRIDYDE